VSSVISESILFLMSHLQGTTLDKATLVNSSMEWEENIMIITISYFISRVVTTIFGVEYVEIDGIKKGIAN
jgi:hypothetical protein